MTKRFKKKELINRLGMNEDKVKLVMEAQKEFPELLERDAKYIDSFRNLYIKLGLDKSNWSRWIKKNIKDNEFFIENKDWWEIGRASCRERVSSPV